MTLSVQPTARVSFGPPALVLIAMAAFALQDIAVKLVSPEISLWQLMMVRSIATLGLMVVAAAVLRQGAALVPKRWGWPMLRAIFMCGAYLCFYASLPFLPVTTAAATFFTGPLMITLMAALVLGEPIGPRRIMAVLVGFAGVVVIVRPGGELQIAALLPLAAAFCYAVGTVLTRWRCKEEANFALSLVHNLVYANIGMIGVMVVPLLSFDPDFVAEWRFLASGWGEPSALSVALILLTAATHLIGVLAIVRAYQAEDASRIAPFEYSYLAMIPALEFLIWHHVPDAMTFLGIALIALAGIFVAWREGRPVRPRVQTQGEHPWTPDAPDPWTSTEGDGKDGA
ncbi:MAG: DMT family transporter [Pseudomonadota bacterium]